MASYLSPEWFNEMQQAADSWRPSDPAPEAQNERRQIIIAENITSSPYGDVSYVMTIGESLAITQEAAQEPADVTFVQDYETATQMHKGDLSTHQALFDGKLRVSGNLNALLENDEMIRGVSPAFSAVREQTTY